MKSTLLTLIQLRDEGLLERFAIGGAIAASFYVEAVATEDLDIFAFLRPAPGGLIVLGPLYDRLRELGAVVSGEHVRVHGWLVQILPAYTPLVEEAVRNAPEQSYEGVPVPVLGAEYLCAIALQTGRAKDYQRVDALLGAECVRPATLRHLIETYRLLDRWNEYVRRYA